MLYGKEIQYTYWLTGPWEIWLWFQVCKFETQHEDWYLEYSKKLYPGMNARGTCWCFKSTLVKVMAWCHKATSHYLNQCWPRSLMPYGITIPQWIDHEKSMNTNSLIPIPIVTEEVSYDENHHWIRFCISDMLYNPTGVLTEFLTIWSRKLPIECVCCINGQYFKALLFVLLCT